MNFKRNDADTDEPMRRPEPDVPEDVPAMPQNPLYAPGERPSPKLGAGGLRERGDTSYQHSGLQPRKGDE